MSYFTIKTDVFQTLVNKAIKGASNNKFSPLTSLMDVNVENNKIKVTTTDTNNYLTIMGDTITSEPCRFTVNVDTFSKLVSKTSVDTIKVTVTEDTITFTGNGTYKLPIQLDVDGSPIKYPEQVINSPTEQGQIKTSVIKNIILHNKPSLATTLEAPYLTGYLCDTDCVISADSFNICMNSVNTFKSRVLVSPIVFELLSMCSEENIDYKIAEDKVLFETPSLRLFATLMPGVDDYPVDTIRGFCDKGYVSDCVIPKTAFLNIVDRLSLFIKEDEQNGVYMTFTSNGLKVESMSDNAIETVPYQGSNNFKDYSCAIGVDSIKRQFSARAGESVNVFYNNSDNSSSTITIKDEAVIQVISLLDDPRVSGGSYEDEESPI